MRKLLIAKILKTILRQGSIGALFFFSCSPLVAQINFHPPLLKAVKALNSRQDTKAALHYLTKYKFLSPPQESLNHWVLKLEESNYAASILTEIIEGPVSSYDPLIINSFKDIKSTWKPNSERASIFCDEACPDNVAILQVNLANREPHTNNSLSFSNNKSLYKKNSLMPKPVWNYCLGHATTTASLRYLATFDPHNRLETVSNILLTSDEEYKQLIKSRLKLIFTKNIPQVFPGFENIKQLSSSFPKLLQYYVGLNWFEYGVNKQNFYGSLNTHQFFSINKTTKLINKMQRMMVHGISPIITFNPWRDKVGHITIVDNITLNEDGSYIISLDDNNVTLASSNSSNLSSLKLTPYDDQFIISYNDDEESNYSLLDKHLWFSDDQRVKSRVGRLELLDSFDDFYARAIPGLRALCIKHSQCL